MPKDNCTKRAEKLLKEAGVDNLNSIPWKFDWNGTGPALIFNAKGICIAVLSTGSFRSRAEMGEVISSAKNLMNNRK